VIRAALFDFGGVILSSPFQAFADYEAQAGLPPGFLRSLNATDPDTNAWARLERGEVGVEAFGPLFEAEARAQGYEVAADAVLALVAGEVRPEMVEAVRRCHRHLLTGLLTNNIGDTHGSPATKLGEDLAHLDVVVESSQIGIRKPDPRFYHLACERLGVTPAEAVFLDDLGVNLKPARAMGMTTIKVTDPGEALEALEAVVGFPLRDGAHPGPT
jgi:putative hydrolase of the HAD superfamily